MVTFNTIPASTRTPAVRIEFDGSRAQGAPSPTQFAALLIGQKRSAGTVAELVPTVITREDQAAQFFGAGSMLQDMARAFLAQSPGAEITCVAIDDPSGGSAATGSVVFAASSPAAGSVAVWIGGRRYSVPVTTSSTASTLASALVSAIAADPASLVTASASTGTVTLTARHVGAAAGAIDIRHSHASDESLPAGVTVTVNAMSGGAGDVDLAEVVAALPAAKQYHVVACPYTDSTNLGVLKTELDSRAGQERQLTGLAFAATTGNFSTAQTLGNAHNSPWLSVMSVFASPSPVWAIAAAVAGAAAGSAAIDPARPFQTLPLVGIVAPKPSALFSRAEREILLTDGVATSVVNASGEVTIERLVTTYQTSPAGAADTAYLDATTVFTLDLIRRETSQVIRTKFPRHKLANDGTRFAPGQAVVTPSIVRAELVALATTWVDRGLVENIEGFKAGLIVQRNALDPSRLDVQMPPDLVNGLIVTAIQIQFRL